MAALTDEKANVTRNLGKHRQFPLAAVKCYKGGLAMINAAGYITPAVAEASNAGIVGVFLKTVDNSAGAAGALNAVVQECDVLCVAVSIAQTDVGTVMYALDDQTIDETQLANQPIAGRLVEYVSATSGWCAVSLATSI
jgi:hypothetical protein